MTAIHTLDHRAAFAFQHACAAVLAALALWALLAFISGVHDAVAMRRAWVSVNGVFGGSSGEGLLKVELHADDAAKLPPLPPPDNPATYQPDHVRVLLPERPYGWPLNLAEPVVLAVRPGSPGQVLLVDALADAAMAIAQAVWALVLGALAWLARRRLDWGRDATWDGAGWSTAMLTAWPPGSQAAQGQTLRESLKLRRWSVVLTSLFGALLLANLIGVAAEARDSPIEAGFSTLVLTLLSAIGVHQVVLSRSRRVQWDDAGVADTSWFRTRRLPWRAIARWQRENTAAESQRRYDRQSISRRKGSRPPDRWVWFADAAGGERLLAVDESMEPPEAQAALRQRIERALWLDAPQAVADATDADEDEEPSAELGMQQQEWQQHEAMFDAREAQMARGLRWGYVAVVAPFLLMFLWPTWSAIRYQFLADRVEGTVVATESFTEVPQLTVQYPGPDGRGLELRTDGSRANRGIAVGTRVTVLRPRADPADAKVDAFWEVWIWPVITAVLLAIVSVPFYIGFIHGPKRTARERAAQRAGRL